MTTYHIHNSDFMELVGRPSQAKTGDVFKLKKAVKGFTGPACRGEWNVPIPAGTYKIVSRKYFRGGTQTIEPVHFKKQTCSS
jgi:hypothetical protein